jgi:hypothetical protein
VTEVSRGLVIGYSVARIAYAVALLAAPGRAVRPWLGEAAGERGTTIAVRGLGARDLALSAGALVAAASGSSSRPWLAACSLSDAFDLMATLVADADRLPARSKPGTAAAAGVFGAAGGLLALRDA